jgi:lipopolysaccharide transport system ATP-binding protein
MSSDPQGAAGTVEVRGLGKCYRLYRRPGDRFTEWISGGRLAKHEEKWALREVDLTLGPGESLGVVGRNGAGKSTLLKIITGTTAPTTGTIRCSGRVSSLLELGTGFHPQFTGRQNVVVVGRIMGLSEDEVDRITPEVIGFAGIGPYIDQPVRTYSSGMQMRLGFALATAVRPDVFIIDEALSVGDIQFQQRCLERVRRFQEQGTSLLLVSHDLSTVASFCKRVLVLEDGGLIFDGEPKAGLERYYASMVRSLTGTTVEESARRAGSASSAPAPSEELGDDPIPVASGDIVTGGCTLRSVRFLDDAGRRIGFARHGDVVDLAVGVLFHGDYSDPHVGFKLHNKDGLVLFETVTYCLRHLAGPVRAGETVVFRFRFRAEVVAGDYTVTIGIADGGYELSSYRTQLAYRSHCAALTVTRDESVWSGLVNLRPTASSARY